MPDRSSPPSAHSDLPALNRPVNPERGAEVPFTSPYGTADDPVRQGEGSEQIKLATDDTPIDAGSEAGPEPRRDLPHIPEIQAPDTDLAVQPQYERTERREPDTLARPALTTHGATWNMPLSIRQSPDMVITRKDDVIELRLTPEELGNLRIMIANRDQVQHVTFLLERPEVLDQFRRHAELLTRQLSEAGIEGSNLEFRQDRGQEQNRSDPRQPRASPGPAVEVAGQALTLALPVSARSGPHDTRLDLRI